MFELITESTERPLREKSPGSKVAAVLTHTAAAGAVIVFVLSRAETLPPEVRTTLAFVAPPLEQPALPAPPPPARSAPATPSPPVGSGGQTDTIAAPAKLQVEPAAQPGAALSGVEAGVEGGTPGGVEGGLVGAVAPVPPPPSPPAPAPRSAAPVRVGGPIKPPALVHRVEPVYSTLAASTQLSGIVILEAVIGTNGTVESVKVLRTPGALLDIAAVDALKQWRYSPLMLNGVATPFVITVTFNFTM